MYYHFKVLRSFALITETFVASSMQVTHNGDLLLLDVNDNIVRAFRQGSWTECLRQRQTDDRP